MMAIARMNMLLFTPGPTPVPESVRLAMATPTLHHRTPEFEAIFAQTRELLFNLFTCIRS
jgi:aspartate aminotransferase-like enzyme